MVPKLTMIQFSKLENIVCSMPEELVSLQKITDNPKRRQLPNMIFFGLISKSQIQISCNGYPFYRPPPLQNMPHYHLFCPNAFNFRSTRSSFVSPWTFYIVPMPFFITRSYNIFIFLRTRMSLFFIGLIAPRDLRPQRRIQRRRTWRALPSCRTVALRSSKVGMGDRKATVPYMQKTFYLRRRFFFARFYSNFSKCLHCSSISDIHKIGGNIYLLVTQ